MAAMQNYLSCRNNIIKTKYSVKVLKYIDLAMKWQYNKRKTEVLFMAATIYDKFNKIILL